MFSEQNALSEPLAHQAHPTRPERQTDGNLLASRRGARQQQVGEVGTKDEEHRRGDTEQWFCELRGRWAGKLDISLRQ